MAAADRWMPLWIGDYLRDTKRLHVSEHGAYLLLIMDVWTNGPLADDDLSLARVVGCTAGEWRKIRPKISGFFTISGGVWRHARVEAERTGAQARSERASVKASKAGMARWHGRGGGETDAPSNASSIAPGNASGIGQALLEQCPLPSPSSVPTEQRETADQRAWREAVALLTGAGKSEAQARRFFGRLLATNKLQPVQMLTAVVGASIKTGDVESYLAGAARNIAERGGPPAPATVEGWDGDVWAHAVRRFRADGAWDRERMGPTPNEPGCRAPAGVLARAA